MGKSVRSQQSFLDKMKRYHGDIERTIYAAEILCRETGGDGTDSGCPNKTCSFHGIVMGCRLKFLRPSVGTLIKQDDCSKGDH